MLTIVEQVGLHDCQYRCYIPQPSVIIEQDPTDVLVSASELRHVHLGLPEAERQHPGSWLACQIPP